MEHVPRRTMFQNLDCVSFQVDNLDAGIEFYADKLGLKLFWRTKSSCGLGMEKDVTEVVLTTSPKNTIVQFKVESVDRALEIFVQAGGKVVVPTFDIDIGKCVVVEDLWGNEFCLLDMTKGRYRVDVDKNVVVVER